jgi:hypothetical protein
VGIMSIIKKYVKEKRMVQSLSKDESVRLKYEQYFSHPFKYLIEKHMQGPCG